MTTSKRTPVRLLAIASGGGHWEQLMAMRSAFEDTQATYMTTIRGLPEKFGVENSRIIPDCNRNEPINLVRCAFTLSMHIFRERPQVVVSTGALPGLIALIVAKAIGSRTIWVDSLANVEEMSMSGRLAKRFSDSWLTQWPEVARATGARYVGRVL